MIIEVVVILLAIPTGFLIRHLCLDELKQGRPWIQALFIACIALSIFFYVFGPIYILLTLVFMAVVSFISLYR